jgi:SAM-dependent methyltransferase
VLPRVFAEHPADLDRWFFDYFAEQKDEQGRRRYAQALLNDLSLAGFDPDGRIVVDAGSGFGVQLLCFAALGARRAIGIEAFRPMARTATLLARRYAPELPAEVVRGSVSAMPLAAGSVDFIYCNEALSHFIDPPGFYREASRALRSGGRLMICDGNNAANRRIVARVHAIWKAFEEGPPSDNVHGHRVDRTYRDRRRRMLAAAFADVEAPVLERLSWGTFGLSGAAIESKAREMLAEGRLPE